MIDIHITLDADKGLFYCSRIKFYEEEYLERHGYKYSNFVRIGKIKQEEVLIKPNWPESLSHTFLVLNIRDELQKKYLRNIKISRTKEPDITFENHKGQTIALEIETGKGFSKHKERIKAKFTNLTREYKKNIYIILTDTNQKRKYKRLLPYINIMTRKDLPTFFAHLSAYNI
jgi:hypothetical protein